MAHEIFRVDLSKAACDFQPTATEPGLPMLDSIGANDALLCRWLGDLVAEPEWRPDDTVAFYVRTGERCRLEGVECWPATKEDLERPLKDDLERLMTGIRRAQPESSDERLLHKIVRQTADRLRDAPDRNDAGCYLMKVRVGKDPWRLLWCWGYQRIDNRPAVPVICRNGECQRLFVHRQGTRALCPGCQNSVTGKRRGGRLVALRNGALAICLLLLLAALAAYGLRMYRAGGDNADRLAGSAAETTGHRELSPGDGRGGQTADVFAGIPATLHLAVDERFDFPWDDEIAARITVESTDSDVAAIDAQKRILARQPGTATVELGYGHRRRTVTLDVAEAKFTSLRIEPAGEAVARAEEAGFTPHGPVHSVAPDFDWGPTRARLVDEGVMLTEVPVGSEPWDRGWRPRMVIRGRDGQPMPADRDWYHTHEPDPDGSYDWDVDHGIPQVTPSVPVAVTAWRPLPSAAEGFVAELDLRVSESAEYRIATVDGTALSAWKVGGPHAPLVITCDAPMARTADGEYKLIVERRMAGKPTKSYPVPLTLKRS